MKTLESQLRGWQRREWLFRALWGGARWSALVLVVLGLACLIDWIIDRDIDTPFWLRLMMTSTQLMIYLAAAYYLILRLQVPSLDDLAFKAESLLPEFGHRLVTALQLNRPEARTAGMSKELISAVTNEAESLSSRHQLANLAEKSLVGMALAVFLPVALIAGGFAMLNPHLTFALLARQALLNVEIPRPVQVKNITKEIWPSGDEVELRFAVTGPVSESDTGTVFVYPEGQPKEDFPLKIVEQLPDGSTVFAAKLPPASADFKFRAKAAGGRTREWSEVKFIARPAVQEVSAWVLMPKYVDPEGKRRYERFQPQGEVIARVDSAVRVEATLSKPVTKATLVVLAGNKDGQESESARIPMTLEPGGTIARAQFEIPPSPIAYRIEVEDEYGFTNLNPPRRGITLAPDDPPKVQLLREVLKDPSEPGPLDDFEVEGMPLVVGGQVQIGYHAASPLGLSRAQVLYRVNARGVDKPWTPLPLSRTTANIAQVGKFLPELGVFEKSGPFGQVEFYPIPSENLDVEPDGIEAGGRINFQTAALQKQNSDGTFAKLEPGDEVEYMVEVFDRNPAPGRKGGTPTEKKVKTVVNQAGFQEWLDRQEKSRERLREIEAAQRGIFGAKPK